jgi:predicted RNA-binding Zn ribbon-like protein
MQTAEDAGGAPLIGDSPALDLVGTHHAVRGKPQEAIGSAEELTAWIGQVAPRLALAGTAARGAAAAAADVQRFHDLRAAVRTLAGNLTSGEQPDREAMAVINAAAELAPSWPRVSLTPGGRLVRQVRTAASGIDAVLASLADDAAEILTGERAPLLRACHAPGCTLFFLKNHPRREWCSPACGTRARAARAYRKRTGAQQ